jgi:UDP:flavonoid glycosyltransferase YjiC (YdhE family)
MLKYCDLVIFHGGYGTRMQVVEQGKPSIIIPFHSEQEYSARQMDSTNSAIFLPFSEEPYTRLIVKWRGGRFIGQKKYSLHLRLKATLKPETLSNAVKEIISSSKAQDNAKKLQQKLISYGGSEKAVELIHSALQ